MKIVALFAVAVMFCLTASFTMADDAAKTVTLKGTATCAKCDLQKTEKCQAALVVKEDGKDVVYYIKGPEAKTIHSEVCKAPKENVEVTGVVSEKDGQKWITTAKKE
jgi:hypothetical protein